MLVLLPAAGVSAQSFAAKDFDQIVAEAEQIFVGTVASTESRRLPTGLIVTDVTFSGALGVKGVGAGAVTLVVAGGTVGEETLRVSGLPEFRVGERYLVFARGNGTAIVPVVGGEQGLFRVARDPATGIDLVLDARGRPIASSGLRRAVGRPASAGESGLPPVPLSVLLEAIRGRVRS